MAFLQPMPALSGNEHSAKVLRLPAGTVGVGTDPIDADVHYVNGTPVAACGGQALNAVGCAGSVNSLIGSLGCWMPTNIVRSSGVSNTPEISHWFGPTRKRRVSRVRGSAHSIWLLPKPA